MSLLTIPFRNMRRKPTKTLLLLVIFSLGVMSIVALYEVSRVVGHSLEKKLSAFGANIVVSPVMEKLSVSYGGFSMGEMLYDIHELPEKETVGAIRSIALNDRLSVVAPKLVSMTRVENRAVALVGVRWKDERGIKSYWGVEGAFPEQDDQILVGSNAATMLGLSAGEVVSLLDEEFTVSGILHETGSDEDSVIFISLPTLQEVTGKTGAVSYIEIAALCAGCPIEDIVGQISDNLPGASVKALQNVVNQRMASIFFVQKLAFSISMVILVTAAAMVGLSMLSAVNERTKDIGVLRSLGYAKSRVFMIFCLEAAMIGAVSGCVGYLVGFGASFKALEFLTMVDGISPVFSFTHLAATVSFFTLLTVVASIFPAWKGASIEPSTALIAL